MDLIYRKSAKIIMCASPQIANPQNFMINPPIAKSENFYKMLHNSVSKQF